jgi:uncharacterized membrane protein YgcG
MLPLAFAAMVWPARRVWAIRAVELLIALILSKFVIVAVVVLGGNAVGQSGGITAAIAGIAILLMAAFTPWMLLRLLPFSEVAASAVGSFGQHARNAMPRPPSGNSATPESAQSTHERAEAIVTAMRSDAGQVAEPGAGRGEETDLAPGDPTPAPRGAGANGSSPGANGGSSPGANGGSSPGAGRADSETDAGAPAPEQPSPPPAERMPSWDPIWQRENLTWRPTLDDDDRPQTPEPPPDENEQ